MILKQNSKSKRKKFKLKLPEKINHQVLMHSFMSGSPDKRVLLLFRYYLCWSNNLGFNNKTNWWLVSQYLLFIFFQGCDVRIMASGRGSNVQSIQSKDSIHTAINFLNS